MTKKAGLSLFLEQDDLAAVQPSEQRWLIGIMERFGGYPNLRQLWQVMDEVWIQLGCSSTLMNDQIRQFYEHPVWLLNGLFIEQHEQSQRFRRNFADWVRQISPVRVADFGGGFGGLAHMIGRACPQAMVDIIEPHPHPLAIQRAEKTTNVRYRSHLNQQYDILIATDVFEHVPDPLALAAETAASLSPGGHFLIANCFYPVILCHLPTTFHFRHTWQYALREMGLEMTGTVAYGQIFKRKGSLDLMRGRRVEQQSRKLWRISQYLPGFAAAKLSKAVIG